MIYKHFDKHLLWMVIYILLNKCFFFKIDFIYLDNETTNHLGVSSYDHSEQLENFVRQQVANQLARKRDHHSTDLCTTDLQKSKRVRYT